MATIWTSDAYAPGNFSLWSGEQEIAGNRATVVTPPAEVGGGPQARAFIGRYRIEAADPEVFGNVNAQRVEAVAFASLLSGNCQGGELWLAWESYFGDPAVVADANAYRPNTGSDWNTLTQFHQSAGKTTQPLTLFVNARSGTAPSDWRFGGWTRGGDERDLALVTPIVKHDFGPFSYGWHEFRAFIHWGQADGRFKVWLDGVLKTDYTGPVGFNPDSTGSTCNYFKQGMYRGKIANNMTIFHAGTRMGTTEADVLAGGGTTPPPPPPQTPPALTRQRRFGVSQAGAGRNGFSQDMKSGSKFATGLAAGEEGDAKDLHVYVEGADGSALTQKLTIGLYADDGGALNSGDAGTKFGEVAEIEVAGNAAPAWRTVTPATPIRFTGANAWVLIGAGAPTNRVFYATEPVASGLLFGADTYEAAAPRLASPAGAMTRADLQMSEVVDYDLVAGTSSPPADTTPPALTTATVVSDNLTLSYDEPLDTASLPLAGDYAVSVAGAARTISAVTLAGDAITLRLSSPVNAGQAVTVSYTSVAGRRLQDVALNAAANLSAFAVANETSTESLAARTLNIARVVNPAGRVIGGTRVVGLGGGGL